MFLETMTRLMMISFFGEVAGSLISGVSMSGARSVLSARSRVLSMPVDHSGVRASRFIFAGAEGRKGKEKECGKDQQEYLVGSQAPQQGSPSHPYSSLKRHRDSCRLTLLQRDLIVTSRPWVRLPFSDLLFGSPVQRASTSALCMIRKKHGAVNTILPDSMSVT
jgi:hypothetical protein